MPYTLLCGREHCARCVWFVSVSCVCVWCACLHMCGEKISCDRAVWMWDAIHAHASQATTQACRLFCIRRYFCPVVGVWHTIWFAHYQRSGGNYFNSCCEKFNMNVGDPPEQQNNGTSTGGGTPCESPVQTVRLNLSANEAPWRRLDENSRRASKYSSTLHHVIRILKPIITMMFVLEVLRTHQQLWMGPIPYPSPATSSVSPPLVLRHEATELISKYTIHPIHTS